MALHDTGIVYYIRIAHIDVRGLVIAVALGALIWIERAVRMVVGVWRRAVCRMASPAYLIIFRNITRIKTALFCPESDIGFLIEVCMYAHLYRGVVHRAVDSVRVGVFAVVALRAVGTASGGDGEELGSYV